MLPNHLTPFSDTHFQGLPVLRGFTMVRQYLESAHSTVMDALRDYPRLYAVRVDLRFPQTYWPLEGQVLGNDYISKFNRSLRAKIDYSQQCSESMGCRGRPTVPRYIWSREYDQYAFKPHFHVLLLLNRDSYHRLGRFDAAHGNLMSRITDAWASALGLEGIACQGLVHVPENAEYWVSRGDGVGLAELFQRVSYMCKAESKCFVDGCHPFGSSRL